MLCLRSREPLGNRAASAWGTSIAEKHFASTDELVVDPDAILVADGFRTWTGRARKQTHARGRLKHIRRKRAAVGIKFHAQIAGVRNPADLISGIENHGLGNQAHQDGAFGHTKNRSFEKFAKGTIAHPPKMFLN